MSEAEKILKRAEKALARHDKARIELRASEDALRGICREYDVVSGCRGIRAEGLRFAINARRAKNAA